MTVTELNDGLVNLINKSELPFDAVVFVIRSIHSEAEQKYALMRQQKQMQPNKTESEEST